MLIATDCTNCIFLENNQCQAGRLPVYESLGLVERSELQTRVLNRVCNMNRHRQSPWALAREAGEWLSLAEKDAQIRVRAAVLVMEDTDQESLEATLHDLANQSIPPRSITVLVNADLPLVHTMAVAFFQGSNHEQAIPWHVMSVAEPMECPLELLDHLEDSLILVNYLVVVEPNRGIPLDWFEEMNRLVNRDMYQLMALSPVDGRDTDAWIGEVVSLHGLVVQNDIWERAEGAALQKLIATVPNVRALCPSVS